ncbi:MAG: LytTR family DNA-binding domain-containing protein [Lachnoclostridium sp.]|nr:LytTR family DNA-binding domain-containing protein [Lachnoclostridium sp.]
MTPLRCCVIDDEPLASGLIASYISKTPFLSLEGEFSSPRDATPRLLAGDFDVVFLDIEMPQLNGIEFARIIPPQTLTIFTTAYDKYAVDGFRVNALDYLLKPISYDDFLSAARRALERHRQLAPADEPSAAPGRFIIVKSDYKLIQIPVDDILYVEGLKDYIKIYTTTSERPILTLISMKNIENTLPADTFMRVHRSYIINTTRIRIIERNHVIIGKTPIPISDSYRQAFTDLIASRTL